MKRLAAIAVLPLLAAACGATQRASAPPTVTVTTTAAVESAQARRCEPGERAVGSDRVAWAAVLRHSATAYRAPDGAVLAEFDERNANDYPTIFAVRGTLVGRDCAARWYRVQVPLRPNGVEGWVRARDVTLERVASRIEVDLSARRIVVFRDGRRVLDTRTAIGAAATPTPTGRYYVNQRLIPDDPSGPFGPAAIGISAFSPVLTGWAQGGPIAIHGTNAPWSIGRPVSNGCLRVANDVARRLLRLAPAGTPVTIHP